VQAPPPRPSLLRRLKGPPPEGAGPEPPGGPGDGPGDGQRPSFVRHLDRDGDGKVSRAEFEGPAEHFSRFDKNRDGYLTEDEAPPFPPPGGRNRPE